MVKAKKSIINRTNQSIKTPTQKSSTEDLPVNPVGGPLVMFFIQAVNRQGQFKIATPKGEMLLNDFSAQVMSSSGKLQPFGSWYDPSIGVTAGVLAIHVSIPLDSELGKQYADDVKVAQEKLNKTK